MARASIEVDLVPRVRRWSLLMAVGFVVGVFSAAGAASFALLADRVGVSLAATAVVAVAGVGVVVARAGALDRPPP